MSFSIEDFLNSNYISERIFYPRWIQEPNPEVVEAEILNILIEPDISISGLFFKNEPELPTLLIFHGNGEIAYDYVNGIEDYMSCGVNVAVVDYRGYGWSNGKPTYLNLYQDAVAIFDKIIEFLINIGYSAKIFTLGRSLGCVSAAEIGAKRADNLLGIIFDSAFADTYFIFQNLFDINLKGISPKDFNPYNVKSKLQKIKKPTLILHGTADNIIPIKQAFEIYEFLPKNILKRLVPIKSAHHNTIHAFAEEYFGEINSFCRRISFAS